jgi:hypothetical protein
MTNPVPNGSWYLKYHHSEAWAFVDNLFTAEECDQIKALAAGLPVQEAKVGKDKQAGDGGELDLVLRKNTVSWMNSSDPEAAWIYRKLTDAVNTVNKQFWEYELDYIETLQYTIYDEYDDHYHGHIDMMLTGLHMRKLSFSLQLDDENSYEIGRAHV